MGEVAIIKTFTDSGKLDLRSRAIVEVTGVDAGGGGVLVSAFEEQV